MTLEAKLDALVSNIKLGALVEEQPLELGSQRLLVSSSLGSPLVGLLESSIPLWPTLPDRLKEQVANALGQLTERPLSSVLITGGDYQTAVAALLRSICKPHIIGAQLKEGDTLRSLLEKLASQLGLPSGEISSRDINDRLAGREKDFVVVVLGAETLSLQERNRLTTLLQQMKLPRIVGSIDEKGLERLIGGRGLIDKFLHR